MSEPLPSMESISMSHRETVAHFRALINFMLDHLEEDMLRPEPPDEAHVAFWWGSRETAVGVLTKLAQVFLKLVPVEQKLISGEEGGDDDAIDEEDSEIIRRYLERLRAGKAAAEEEIQELRTEG